MTLRRMEGGCRFETYVRAGIHFRASQSKRAIQISSITKLLVFPVVDGGQAGPGHRAGSAGLEYGLGEGRGKSEAKRKPSEDRMGARDIDVAGPAALLYRVLLLFASSWCLVSFVCYLTDQVTRVPHGQEVFGEFCEVGRPLTPASAEDTPPRKSAAQQPP